MFHPKNVWGTKIVNCTPHPITFGREGIDEVIVIEASGTLLNARPEETLIGELFGVTLVTTKFIGDKETKELLSNVPKDVFIVGSIISAQAYPGEICAMIPVKGFERVPPAEKRMRHDKFTIF